MSDDRPPAPTYGPPITIPSAYFLGLVAYNAWCDAHLDDPAVDWMELSEAERAMWQRIATKVAERIRDATEHSHALGNYLPPPRCRAKRRDLYTLYICCRWDPTRPKLAPMTKATVGCRSSRELAAAALTWILQRSPPQADTCSWPGLWTHGWHQPRVWAGHELQRGSSRAGPRVALDAPVRPMPEEAAMAKSWRCRLRLHRWQRIRGPNGQWYRECRDCGTQLIDRYKEGPPPTAIG